MWCEALDQAYLGELEDAPHFPDELGLALRAGLNQDAVGLVVVYHGLMVKEKEGSKQRVV